MLVRLAGARPDLLAKAPGERYHFASTGAVLLVGAVVAGISAYFALTMTTRLSVPVAVVVSVGWVLLVLGFSRLLVVTVTRGRWTRQVLAVGPRLLLAALVGAVVAAPLVLQVFRSEVEVQLQVLAAEKIAAFGQELSASPRYAVIPDLQRQLADELRIADSTTQALVDADPAVVRARTAVQETRTRYETAQQLLVCEISGTCGTGRPGVGDAVRERQSARDVSLKDYDDAKARLARAEQDARTSAPKMADGAETNADRLATQLNELRSAQATELSAFAQDVRADTGLLSRLEALSAIGGRGIGAAQWMMFALFTTLHMQPVLTRLIRVTGAPTLYDELVRLEDDSAMRIARREIDRNEQVAAEYAERRADLEMHQAGLQYEAGLRVNERLVAEKARIAEEAIRRWATVAAGLAKAETSGLSEAEAREFESLTRELEMSAAALHTIGAQPFAFPDPPQGEPPPLIPAQTDARVRLLDDDAVVGTACEVDFAYVRPIPVEQAASSRPIAVRILLDAPDAKVSPTTQIVALAADRTCEPVLFEVVPHLAGKIELRFRVYTAADGQLLQEISTSLVVGRPDARTLVHGHDRPHQSPALAADHRLQP
ncbi:hypothetical protein JOD54_004213 [Actinokineospora baliensis]|uniref:DUF4407 domain-containing protein n=1 Tax=Actinokineospora baliensis TaxID=547056 RepID=UPI0019582455|nr:DUF4407 domain-containing protein [Actinokineospora baliensis]MBM7774009.1 hypothetical protein [Actinokineospora baliensis]